MLLKVNERNSIPVIAILVTTVIACLLSLINIGSSVAFNDVVALSVNGLYTSYLIGNGLLLWRRLAGDIHSPSETEDGGLDTEKLSWGLWRLPESIGTINNWMRVPTYCLNIQLFSRRESSNTQHYKLRGGDGRWHINLCRYLLFDMRAQDVHRTGD